MGFVASGISNYVESVAKYPSFSRPSDWGDKSKAERLITLNQRLGHPESCELLGTALLIHWRNRSVHSGSNASLSSRQQDVLRAASGYIHDEFKNLEVDRLLADFKNDKPTLKEISSLIAMSIRLIKRLDESVLAPTTIDDLQIWLSALGLEEGLARARKTAQSPAQKLAAAETYLRTHCPMLAAPYRALLPDV
ncbi:hypothetical protein ACQKRQ_23000 [Paraburkholderia sp. NPDC080076]|uniref:hypothetical protein n=1 Tax=Paraburkholderia sp. NPDC080076 TaxID=3390605 RepID=UPI003CFDB1BD